MLKKMIDICRRAGGIIQENFYIQNKVDKKSSIDLVTDVDVKVEKYVIQELSREFPDVKIIAEESLFTPLKTENPVFYLDPIDGTTNFVHGFPFVAVSLGYYENNTGKHGVVYNPVMDELFTASKGNGAFCNGKGIRVSKSEKLINSLIGTGFPYSVVEKNNNLMLFERFKNIVENSRGIRRAGSAALDLCYTARGVFDGYYESGLKPWDVAAGIIILKEAGGRVSGIEGENFNFEKDWIVASNAIIHEQILKVVNL